MRNGKFDALKFSSISTRQWAIRQPFPSDTDLFFLSRRNLYGAGGEGSCDGCRRHFDEASNFFSRQRLLSITIDLFYTDRWFRSPGHEISIINRELPHNIKAERSFKQNIDASIKRNHLFFPFFLMDTPMAWGVTLRRWSETCDMNCRT